MRVFQASSHRLSAGIVAAALALGTWLMPQVAQAAKVSPPVQNIFGGRQADVCSWPTAVRLGGCSATLVHPEIVVYAAHCGANHSTATLGDGREIALRDCTVNPAYDREKLGQGIDWAFCRVANPAEVAGIELVPMLDEVEADALKVGTSLTLVGYGMNDQGAPFGTKFEVQAPITELGQEMRVGGSGLDTCQGDSGGPAFVQLDDGTWRVAGITSYGGKCGTGGYYSLMHRARPWIEAQSGMRMPGCGNEATCPSLPLDPGGSYGTWDNACAGGPLRNPATSTVAPAISFVAPTVGEYIEVGDDLHVLARIDAASALAVVEVRLDRQVIVTNTKADVEVEISDLAAGQHLIEIFATDVQGEVGVAQLSLQVRQPGELDDADVDGTPAVTEQKEAEQEPAALRDPAELGCSAGGSRGGIGATFIVLGCCSLVSRRRRAKQQ